MRLNNYWPAPWVGSYIDPWDVTGSYLRPVPYNPENITPSPPCGVEISDALKEYLKNARKDELKKKHGIDHVIFNGDATIVFWNDGEKTVVKRSEGECDDREKAILTAFAIKTLGGKPELNKMMRKAFTDKEPKRYHWTDICKIRFYKPDPLGNALPDKKLKDFMNDIEKNFEMFGYISLGKLRDLVAYHDILKNGPAPFELPKFDWSHVDARLGWTNLKDFGIAKAYDAEKKRWYDHIYIRRSPEPMPYPDDGKGEEE